MDVCHNCGQVGGGYSLPSFLTEQTLLMPFLPPEISRMPSEMPDRRSNSLFETVVQGKTRKCIQFIMKSFNLLCHFSLSLSLSINFPLSVFPPFSFSLILYAPSLSFLHSLLFIPCFKVLSTTATSLLSHSFLNVPPLSCSFIPDSASQSRSTSNFG